MFDSGRRYFELEGGRDEPCAKDKLPSNGRPEAGLLDALCEAGLLEIVPEAGLFDASDEEVDGLLDTSEGGGLSSRSFRRTMQGGAG